MLTSLNVITRTCLTKRAGRYMSQTQASLIRSSKYTSPSVLRGNHLDRVGKVEAPLGLHHIGELPDNVLVLAVQREFHLGFVLLEILSTHPVSLSLLSFALVTTRAATLRYDMRCCGDGPAASMRDMCSAVLYPLWIAKS